MSQYPTIRPDALLPEPTSGTEKFVAAASHASPFFGLPILVPLVVLVAYPALAPASAYVRYQAMQALMFHLFVTIVAGALFGAATGLWALVLIGWIPALVLTILGGLFLMWAIVIEVLAVLKAFNGAPYGLPVVSQFGR